MTIYDSLIQKLHKGKSYHAGFPANEWAGAWYGDHGAMREIFKTAIDKANPGLIVEVGSFVGESAIFMADYLGSRDAAVLCVDTWLGGFDHIKGAPEKFNMHFGRADFFYRFMSNVMVRGQQNKIVPLAMDSLNAARVLKWMGIQADMVYADASHEESDVLRDYVEFWELIRPGGIMLCDDWSGHFPGVLADGKRFIEKTGVEPFLIEGEKVLFVKP